jgi:hypothetical protein
MAATGFLLTLRVNVSSGFWTTVLPAMLLVALGVACATTPLTSAVLSSVAR